MYVKAAGDTEIRFPYTIDDLCRDNPETSFPSAMSDEVLAEFHIYPVVYAPSPQCNAMTEFCVYDDTPQLISGNWVLGCQVLQKPIKEASNSVRKERNRLLSECDWVTLSSLESNTTVPQHWVNYRKALRDIPEQTGFPYAVEWPSLNNPSATK